MAIELMSASALQQMRASCTLAGQTLVMISRHLRIGMTTDEINTLVHDFIVANQAYPSPLNYKGFPKSVCTSVNEVVCHGIPDSYALKNGDIVNVDVTTYLPKEKGFHGDTSATFYIGEPSEEAKRVVETARHCLELGIAVVKDGARLWDIGGAIEEYAHKQGCSVVQDYVGHGIGRLFHMEPQVPHYRPKQRAGIMKGLDNPKLKSGMVFTIEPMINIGAHDTEVMKDKWTVLTRDRKLSAQFEHTILVTATGVEVLTDRSEVLVGSEDVAWAKVGPLASRVASEGKNHESVLPV